LNIYNNKTDAYNNTNVIYSFYNLIIFSGSPIVTQGQQILTFQIVNNKIVLKTAPFGFTVTSGI